MDEKTTRSATPFRARPTKNIKGVSPTVSVIVVLHDERPFVPRCLAAVLSQTGPSFEVIVVDNQSTDGGPAWLEAHHPEVQVIHASENLGYAGGINRGLEAATGRYIAPLNMDTEVAPGWLEALVTHLEVHPDVGAVTPLIVIDQQRDRVNAMGAAIHLTGLSFCNGLNQPVGAVPTRPFPVPGVSGASFVIRRGLLDSLGGAPAECFMGNDDVILSWKLRLLGWDIHCVPSAVVCHSYHLTFSPEKLFLVERNRHGLLLETLKPRTLLALAPLFGVTETAILAYCLVKGRPYLQAKLRSIHAVWQQRRAIRARRSHLKEIRQVGDRALLKALKVGLPWGQLSQIIGPTAPRETAPRASSPPDSDPDWDSISCDAHEAGHPISTPPDSDPRNP